MSSAPAVAREATHAADHPSDRRLHRRYPIRLEADYRLLRRGLVGPTASARTVNIGSGGVFLETPQALSPGSAVELMISWPLLLEGVCPLKLVMVGRVVRAEGKGVAIQTKHHEFRTAGTRGQSIKALDLRVRSFVG